MQKKSFKIDNDIYSQDAIKQAIKDFSESYSFEFIEDILNIEAEDENEIEEIFGEFMNYVLGLQNENY